jgi:thiol-disulfide isomerase/thioredoxin
MKLFITFILLTIVSIVKASDSDPMPDCKLSLEKSTQALNTMQYRGQVVYVDFWASWCAPCLKSFPFMNQMHQQYASQGLKIIAVNLDEQREDADNFTRQTPHDFSVAYDNQDRSCANAFAVKAMPTSYLIDKKGTIRQVFMGFKTEETEQMRGLIESLLAE